MITISVEAPGELGLLEAKRLAEERAAEQIADPMVLAWLEKRTGRYSPDVECCGDDCRPAWQIYAESRGGSVRVDVGDQYTFILREGLPG